MKSPNSHATFISIAKKLLNKDEATIVELGARDCRETVSFAKNFPHANIYSFECNPATLPQCREAVRGYPNIHLIEKAISNKNGTIEFYPTNKEKTKTTWIDGNPGASSLFKASGKYPVETYVQDTISVPTTRMDSFMEQASLTHIDLLWMDIQGAELMALQSLGNCLPEVSLIHTEVEFFEIYQGQPLFADIKRFLNAHGFWLIGFTSAGRYAGDAVFINRKIVRGFWPSFRMLFINTVAPWRKQWFKLT